jgi:ATP-dependent DNA helicase RecQ
MSQQHLFEDNKNKNFIYQNQKEWSKAVKERDSYQCVNQNNDIYHNHTGDLEAHHIFPKQNGGKNLLSNGITLCKECHASFLVEAEQKYYHNVLNTFLITINDFLRKLVFLPSEKKYYQLLHFITGSRSFRKSQLRAIKSVIEHNKNLIFVSPTGTGKSMIYQLIGMLTNEPTLIISPLMALQKDQVESLWRKWIPATFINSSLDPDEKKKRVMNILREGYLFIFAHPKQFLIRNNSSGEIDIKLSNILTQVKFGTLCIDEAHVIDTWGKSFIEEYSELRQLRNYIKFDRTLLLSASLNRRMQADVVKNLFSENEEVELIVTGFFRPEVDLFVETFFPTNQDGLSKLEFINSIIKEKQTKSIIFVNTVIQVEEVTKFLKLNRIHAEGYHGKLDTKLKQSIQARFNELNSKMEENVIDVLVCTSAFGMGINIPNIHLSIHYSFPFSINDYYQQFGRIGRDGIRSQSYLLYNDLEESKSIVHYIHSKEIEKIDDVEKKIKLHKRFETEFNDLKEYAISTNKWQFILDHFGSDDEIKNNSEKVYYALIIIISIILIYLIFLK